MIFAPTNVWLVVLMMRPQTLVRRDVKCLLLVCDINRNSIQSLVDIPKLCF